jgi:hypothetical protein
MRLKYPGGQARMIFATIASVLITSLAARAMALFEFAGKDRRYVFEIASAAPVPASVDQERAAQRALQWAPGFYGAQELDLVDIAFKIKPALVWLVTFQRPGTDAPLFAVVLPDGEVLDPRVLIGI